MFSFHFFHLFLFLYSSNFIPVQQAVIPHFACATWGITASKPPIRATNHQRGMKKIRVDRNFTLLYLQKNRAFYIIQARFPLIAFMRLRFSSIHNRARPEQLPVMRIQLKKSFRLGQ